MSFDPEPIYAALFAQVAAIPDLKTTSRKLLHWADVPAKQRPALFTSQRTIDAVTETRQLTKWSPKAWIYIYVSSQNGEPSTLLNTMIAGVAAALANPFPGVPQTLGGLVEYCRIEGTIETDEGTLGDDAVARIPVAMLVAA